VGYEEAKLRLGEAPSHRLRNLPRLLDQTRERNCLNTLLRWFWLGVSAENPSTQAVPDWFIELSLSVGLLQRTGDTLSSDVMLFPAYGLFSVCDHSSKIDSEDVDFVLWPNPTSHLLSRFTVRRHSRTTLDLGTGNAIQALAAAGHSGRVTATDVNPRAITYAKFAAALNGLDNIECLEGNGFEPVGQRKFDLIVSNPPFFISPTRRHAFCDSSMGLDHLCRRFLKEGPAYLNEGGYFQILCEWAQIRGQSWQERVAEWVEGSGCDAWILKVHTQDPAQYAQVQLSLRAPSEQDTELYNHYVSHYCEANVEAIHDGIIALRRRSGQNWLMIDEFAEIPKEPFGAFILRFFDAQDFLRTHGSPDQFLSAKLRLSPDSRLEQAFEPGRGHWHPGSLTLRMTKGFPFVVQLQPPIAELLSSFDGSRTTGDVIQGFASQVDAPLDNVQAQLLSILRGLIERGFVLT